MEKTFYEQLCEKEKSYKQEQQALEKSIEGIQLKLVEVSKKLESITFLKSSEEKDGARGVLAPHGRLLNIPVEKSEFPKIYDENLTQLQKTYVALCQIKSGFSRDITAKLQELDPKDFGDWNRADKMVRTKLVELHKNKVIGYKAYGRKYKYFVED